MPRENAMYCKSKGKDWGDVLKNVKDGQQVTSNFERVMEWIACYSPQKETIL